MMFGFDKMAVKKSLFILITGSIPLLLFMGGPEEKKPAEDTQKIKLPDGYEVRYFEDLRYGLFIPPTYDPAESYPLIVCLHGKGDTVSWDLPWYHDPIQAEDPCFVITPKTLATDRGWGHSWNDEHSKDMKKTLQVLALLRQEFNIDPNRLYIHGTSMGGFGTFSALTKEAGMFAAAFSICGGGNPEKAGLLVDTPLWIFHGSADNIVPVRFSRDVYRAIVDAGGKQVRLTEYPGVGHPAWTPAWKEPTLTSWLLVQVKGVKHAAPDPVENVGYEIPDDNQVKLVWTAPSDHSNPDNRIWYYKVFHNSELIAEIDNKQTCYIDTVVYRASTQSYSISTVNYFFRESERTAPLIIRLNNEKP